MIRLNLEVLKLHLKNTLSPERFRHTQGVVETSAMLCDIFQEDKEKAIIAAWFHDYAKEYSSKELISFLKNKNCPIDEIEKKSTQLLHGKVAAIIAKEKYHILDQDILNAIYYHTTGRKNMSRLELIVAFADCIEPSRTYPFVNELRQYSTYDLELGFYHALNYTIAFLIKENKLIHPLTIEARNDLMERCINRKVIFCEKIS